VFVAENILVVHAETYPTPQLPCICIGALKITQQAFIYRKQKPSMACYVPRKLIYTAAFFIVIAVFKNVDSFTPRRTEISFAIKKIPKIRSKFFLSSSNEEGSNETNGVKKKKIAVVGAGWAGLSVAHALSKYDNNEVVVIEASPRVGGLVRDGYTTMQGTRPAEAGQHGFWDNYHNIFSLLEQDLASTGFDIDDALTGYAEQGQYSPKGLEAVWPVYRDQAVTLPTGLAQAIYTKFKTLPILDRITAVPLVLAFSEFDDSIEAWQKYDSVSFRDLCVKLGVSKRCYEEAFEPMILTGLFAPGAECSAAAALGMAYFFVLKSQNSFDVRWCRGNIGNVIFDPWIDLMKENNVSFQTNTRVTGFQFEGGEHGTAQTKDQIRKLQCYQTETGEQIEMEVDDVVMAVGAEALNAFVRFPANNSNTKKQPQHDSEEATTKFGSLSKYPEFRKFANLRGTSVLATRIFLDKMISIPYSANACWGFDDGIGMTMFDITNLHGQDCASVANTTGSVIEVDYYHANPLLVMDDESLVEKVKRDIDTIIGQECKDAEVLDAAIVKLPKAVNWYYPGSYKDMPDLTSNSLSNLYFVGDIVRTRHGSWSQEKAYVTGIQASNAIMGENDIDKGVVPLEKEENHVQFGRDIVTLAKTVLGLGDASRGPSLVDFLY